MRLLVSKRRYGTLYPAKQTLQTNFSWKGLYIWT